MSINIHRTVQYSNYSVVSFPHYSSSIVVLTVIGHVYMYLSIEHHSSDTVITILYTDSITKVITVTICH